MLKYHIKTIEVTADTGGVLFNNLPNDYDELYVSYSFRHTGTGENAYPWSPLYVAVNGIGPDLFRNLYGFTDATGSDYNSNFPMGTDTSATANVFSIGDFTIFNANNSNTKPVYGVSATENNAGPALNYTNSAHFSTTEPVRSISFYVIFNQIAIGSFVSVYGIKRGINNIAQVSPTVVGNTQITTSNGYTYVAFGSSGTFVSPVTTTAADVLVVGGGGSGGGGDIAGGGGAGGYVATSNVSLTAGASYSVIVGAGGPTSGYALQGFTGSNSSFASITANGGGGGGTRTSTNSLLQNGGYGASGGGGGGAVYNTATGGPGITGQGKNGGNGYVSGDGNAAGGGGGGSTSAGSNGSYSTGAAGGAGTAWLNGIYYSGGGGGAGNTGGAGGIGGGGAGYRGQAPVPGRQNTGGGGGGAGGIGGYNNGGSGIVIIRYLTPA